MSVAQRWLTGILTIASLIVVGLYLLVLFCFWLSVNGGCMRLCPSSLIPQNFADDIRLAVILTAPMLALFAGWVAIWRTGVAERDSDTEKRNVQSKSLHGAIQLLDSKKSYARQGALRALEAYINVELDRDTGSELDKQRHIRKKAIFDLIAGFIQARAPLGQSTTAISDTAEGSGAQQSNSDDSDVDTKKTGAQESNSDDSDVDIRTAIAILRENYKKDEVQSSKEPSDEKGRREKYVFDLSNSKFPRNADFSHSNLSPSNFSDSEMHRAIFEDAELKGSNFVATLLSYAYFARADLSDANFTSAVFSGADLSLADFRKANLSDAKLDKANLSGAKLKLAESVTQDMLDSAFGDPGTSFPSNLQKPEHWHTETAPEDPTNHEAWENWLKSEESKQK